MPMITATAWVPRGYAAPFPRRYDFDEHEFERIQQLAKLQLNDAKADLEEARNRDGGDGSATEDKDEAKDRVNGAQGVDDSDEDEDDDDDLKEYDLEHYDDDDKDAEQGGMLDMFSNIKSLAYHESNAEDPYITMPENEGSDDDEREELQILETDNLLLAGRVEDEVAHLECYVYEDSADNLYVHHDIMLPAIPLAVEWLNSSVGKKTAEQQGNGNYVAVGTMDPDIEIWDLDTVDCMYPNAVLGYGEEEKRADEGAKTKRKKRSKKTNEAYHVDAVLSLAANRRHRNLLASSSADKSIKLWDLNTCTAAKSYSYHTDKVCSVDWNPGESTVLLSGSYDRTVVAADMRAAESQARRWGVESDVESVRWDPHDSNLFYATTESGVVHHFDARSAPSRPEKSKAVWTLQAHDEAVSSFDVNPVIPGFLATGGNDKQVKLWKVQASGPSMVVSRNLEVGRVFSTKFAPDQEVGFRLAVAGSKGRVQIWDTSTNAAVRRAFANRVKEEEGGKVKERLVQVEQDSSESDSDEEEEEEEGEGADKEGEGQADGWESMEE